MAAKKKAAKNTVLLEEQREIRLTIPGKVPSKANSYRRSAGGALFSTKAIKDFDKVVIQVMQEAKCVPFTGPICVEAWVYPPDMRSDLCSIEKGLNDSLQSFRRVKKAKVELAHGAYKNDSQIRRYTLEFGGIDKINPRVELRITPWVPQTKSW